MLKEILLENSKKEIIKAFADDFNKGKEKFVEKVCDNVISKVKLDDDKEEITNNLKKAIVSEVGNCFDDLILEENFNISVEDIPEIPKEKVIQSEVKDTFVHDMIVGGSTLIGAMALGMLLKRIAGNVGGVAGAFIGGFIGSAAGSGIGEDFITKELKEFERVNAKKLKIDLKETVKIKLEDILEKNKEKILEIAKEILEKEKKEEG